MLKEDQNWKARVSAHLLLDGDFLRVLLVDVDDVDDVGDVWRNQKSFLLTLVGPGLCSRSHQRHERVSSESFRLDFVASA